MSNLQNRVPQNRILMQKMQGSHSCENILLYESIDIVAVSISMYLAIRANIAIFQHAARHSWYHMLRPENLRDELVEFGVASFVNGRWVIFPDKWQRYVAQNHRPRTA